MKRILSVCRNQRIGRLPLLLLFLIALGSVATRNVQAGLSCELTCPTVSPVGNDTGDCGAKVTYPPPTEFGDCVGVGCSPPSGSFFPVGTTTVNCMQGATFTGITPSGGRSCFFFVTVNDTEGPMITCPANVTAECTGGLTPVTFGVPVASDNCASHGGPTVFCLPPSGSGFRLGSSNVVCYAVDVHFLTNSCSFSVTVEDTSPPIVTCPSDITVTESSPGSGSAVVTYIALASDPCGLASFNCAPASGSTFTIGSTEVTCTATNSSGLAASCSFDVTVVGACIIICPANINAIGVGSANVTYPAPTTTNCGTATVVCTPSSGSSFPVGTTTVTCETEFDGAGPSCSFAVTVISPCDAIEAIVLALDAGGVSRKDSKPLIASLKAACASFERESIGSGINQLQAFQNKVQSQIAPTNPTLAALLIAMAQAIIDAVSP